LPDLTSGDLHLRWYMYVPAAPAALYIAPIHVVDAAAPFGGVIVSVKDDGLVVNCTESGQFVEAPASVPRDRWVCIQLRVVISDTAGSVAASVDGVGRATLTGIDTLPPNGYRNIHAGSYASGTTADPTDVWIDELVAGTSAIPCD
jgi:hypothetical protein